MTGQVVVPASAGAAAAAAVTQTSSESKGFVAKISDRMFEKVVPTANAVIKFNYEGFLCVTPTNPQKKEEACRPLSSSSSARARAGPLHFEINIH